MNKPRLSRLNTWAKSHKAIVTLVVIVVIVVAYIIYRSYSSTTTVTQYVLSSARTGSITETVTGSGQVSAENQIDVKSEVSGKILKISASIGERVKAGDLIATIDSSDAAADLESARISLAKLTKPATSEDIANTKNALDKTYSDAWSAMDKLFLDAPQISDGLNTMLYTSTGFLSNQRATNLGVTFRDYVNTASVKYGKFSDAYPIVLTEYKSLTRSSPKSSVLSLLDKTITLSAYLSDAVKATQTAISAIKTNQTDYYPSEAATAQSTVSSWSSNATADASSLLSTKTSISNSQTSYDDLVNGADSLDIQSQQLAVTNKSRVYSKYFIRAPFDGTIGRIPVNIYDMASNGTTIATIVSDRKITTIPLNEVDAVKVKKGDFVTLTFDALPSVREEGEVSDVDLVGTQSSGVVTYNIKISFGGTNQNIRPGMSTDVSVVTSKKDGILVVPSSAIKTQSGAQYVETFPRNASTTTVIQSAVAPGRKKVSVGSSDGTLTEIVSGLSEGDMVVTRTITASSATASQSTPSLFSGFGGQRTGSRQTGASTR